MKVAGKLHPDFVPLQREAIRELRAALQHEPAAAWTLVQLVAEADHRSGTIRGSIRWLAGQLGMRRYTLARHLSVLEGAGLLVVKSGRNQYSDAFIELTAIDFLRGAGPVAGTVAGTRTGPADRPLPGGMAPGEVEEVQDLDLRSRDTQDEGFTPISPAKRGNDERERNDEHELFMNPLYPVLAERLGYEPLTRREVRTWSRCLEDLNEVGATPEELTTVLASWRLNLDFDPTPNEIVRHWAQALAAARDASETEQTIDIEAVWRVGPPAGGDIAFDQTQATEDWASLLALARDVRGDVTVNATGIEVGPAEPMCYLKSPEDGDVVYRCDAPSCAQLVRGRAGLSGTRCRCEVGQLVPVASEEQAVAL